MAQVRFGSKSVTLPRSRIARIGLGMLFLLGGILWFLPILGIWMIPLGLMVLAADSHAIRRFNRRIAVAVLGWWNGRKSKLARRAANASRDAGTG